MKRFLLLLILVLFAIVIRLYHIGFPAIGYHNMKENEYLGAAELMKETGDYARERFYFVYNWDKDTPPNVYAEVLWVPYQILLCQKFLGIENLWCPRLIQVLFMAGAIIIMYHLCYLLLPSASFAYLASFILAIMPLGIYFGRNLQPESPAFFWMLLSFLAFLKFIKEYKLKFIFLFSISFLLTLSYKISFILPICGLIFLIPLLDLRKFSLKKWAGVVVIVILPVLLLLLWWKSIDALQFNSAVGRIKLFSVFTPSYWRQYGQIILNYAIRENFTIFYMLFAIIGMSFISMRFLRNKKDIFSYFIIVYGITIIPYFMFFSDFINQHNYYQMPFLSLVVICSSYFIIKLSAYASSFFKERHFIIQRILIAAIILITLPSVYKSALAPYRTVFFGQDVAGAYLNKITKKQDRFFALTFSQGYATCRYACRKCGWPSSLEDFKNLEEKLHIKHLYIYPPYFFESIADEFKEYIRNNYSLLQIGLLKTGKNLVPYYWILEKGGKLKVEEFMNDYLKNIRPEKVYELEGKKYIFYTMGSG